MLIYGLALGRHAEGGHIVPALEELDSHGRGRLEQIIAPPFGNGCDRGEQSAVGASREQ